MLKNYFKIALRNLRKSATYSFICRCVQAALVCLCVGQGCHSEEQAHNKGGENFC